MSRRLTKSDRIRLANEVAEQVKQSCNVEIVGVSSIGIAKKAENDEEVEAKITSVHLRAGMVESVFAKSPLVLGHRREISSVKTVSGIEDRFQDRSQSKL